MLGAALLLQSAVVSVHLGLFVWMARMAVTTAQLAQFDKLVSSISDNHNGL